MDTSTPPAVAAAPTVPPPLSLQQRAEKAAEALRLVRELHADAAHHGDFLTFQGGRSYAALEAASSAMYSAAYYAEHDYKTYLAEQLAQVAARA